MNDRGILGRRDRLELSMPFPELPWIPQGKEMKLNQKPDPFSHPEPKWLAPAIIIVLFVGLSYGSYVLVMCLCFEKRLVWWEAVLATGVSIVAFSIGFTAILGIGVGLHHGLGAIGASLNRWVFDRKIRNKKTFGLTIVCRFVWFLCGGIYGLIVGGFMGFFIGGWISGDHDRDQVFGGIIGAVIGGMGCGIVFGRRYMWVGGPPKIEPGNQSWKWEGVSPLNPERQKK